MDPKDDIEDILAVLRQYPSNYFTSEETFQIFDYTRRLSRGYQFSEEGISYFKSLLERCKEKEQKT